MCDTEVECDYETYDRLVDCFSNMEYQAGEYVPDEADMDRYVEHGDGSYMDFLIWIMETGVETEENRFMRRRINAYLREHLTLTDEKPAWLKRGWRQGLPKRKDDRYLCRKT